MCPNSAQLDVSRAGVRLGLKHGNSSVSHTQPRRPEQTGRTITEQEVTIELPNYNPEYFMPGLLQETQIHSYFLKVTVILFFILLINDILYKYRVWYLEIANRPYE